MHRRDRIIEDFGAALIQMIHQRVYRAFVPGDKARGQYYDVVLLHADLRMRIGREPRQGRKRFTLAPARKEGQFVRLEKISLGAIDKRAGRKVELPGLHPKAHALRHPAPQRHDVASRVARSLGHLAHAMEMRRERRKEKLAARTRDQLSQYRLERTLRAGTASALDVGRIREQKLDTLGAETREALGIEHDAVDRRRIDLEIATVNDHARRRPNRQCERVERRMGYADRLDFKRPQTENHPRRDLSQIGAGKLVFDQVAARERERYLAAVHGGRKAFQQVRQRADMVLVRMGEDDALDVEAGLLQIGELGYQEAAAERTFLGEHNAGVDHDGALAALDHQKIQANFAETAERYNSDGIRIRSSHQPLNLPPPRGRAYRLYKAGTRHKSWNPKPHGPGTYQQLHPRWLAPHPCWVYVFGQR